jgi:hypothetical protein
MTDMKNDQHWHEVNRRHSERHVVDFAMHVTDLDQGMRLGDVVDINLSGSGMRIMGETPIPVDTVWRVQLNIVLGDHATTEEICFETRSLWSQYVEGLGLYETGFDNTLSPSARLRIEHLIYSLIDTAVHPSNPTER